MAIESELEEVSLANEEEEEEESERGVFEGRGLTRFCIRASTMST